MDKDFHYYATYAAARYVGYNEEKSGIIAYAAQFVDECDRQVAIDNEWIPALNGGHCERTIPTISTETVGTLYLDENEIHRIWMPFHFLPGNFDEIATIAYNGDIKLDDKQTKLFKMICLPNSFLSRKMIQDIKNKDDYHRIGLCMHVLADTYAHAFFAGTCERCINNIDDNQVYDDHYGKIQYSSVFPYYEENAPDTGGWPKSPFLGHGRIGHIPDYPKANYFYKPDWNTKTGFIGMYHRESYLAAFGAMVNAMHCIIGEINFPSDDFKYRINKDFGDAIADIFSNEPDLYKSYDTSVSKRCQFWKDAFAKNAVLKKYGLPNEFNRDLWIEEFKNKNNDPTANFALFQRAARYHAKLVAMSVSKFVSINWDIPTKIEGKDQVIAEQGNKTIVDVENFEANDIKLPTDSRYEYLFKYEQYYKEEIYLKYKYTVRLVKKGVGVSKDPEACTDEQAEILFRLVYSKDPKTQPLAKSKWYKIESLKTDNIFEIPQCDKTPEAKVQSVEIKADHTIEFYKLIFTGDQNFEVKPSKPLLIKHKIYSYDISSFKYPTEQITDRQGGSR